MPKYKGQPAPESNPAVVAQARHFVPARPKCCLRGVERFRRAARAQRGACRWDRVARRQLDQLDNCVHHSKIDRRMTRGRGPGREGSSVAMGIPRDGRPSGNCRAASGGSTSGGHCTPSCGRPA